MTTNNPNTNDLLEQMDRETKKFLARARMENQIDEDLEKLKTKAIAGNNNAIHVLHYLAAHATSTLDEVATKDVSLVIPIARKLSFWPVLSGPYESVKKVERKFFKRIQLGKSPAAISPHKLFSRFSVARETAVMIVSHVNAFRTMKRTNDQLKSLDNSAGDLPTSDKISDEFLLECGNLPEFSEHTVDKWYPVCRELLMLIFEGQPEKVKELRSIGIYRAGHNSDKKGKSQESNIRDGIFTQIKRAMEEIAKVPN